jgi:hypothetical protein
MEIKLLNFVQKCKRLAKQALGKRAGEPASVYRLLRTHAQSVA